MILVIIFWEFLEKRSNFLKFLLILTVFFFRGESQKIVKSQINPRRVDTNKIVFTNWKVCLKRFQVLLYRLYPLTYNNIFPVMLYYQKKKNLFCEFRFLYENKKSHFRTCTWLTVTGTVFLGLLNFF